MANFKIKFLNNNNTLSLTNCCCPNVVNLVCSDMELAREYTVYFNDTSPYRAQVFPAKYTFIAEGRLKEIKLRQPGSNYTSIPTVTISGGGARVNAKATATLSSVQSGNRTIQIVSGITITDPGEGYTSIPTVTISGGGGSGAEAVAIVGDVIKNLSFFVAFGCDDRKMPIPTPYPSNTPTVTPTNTLTPTPSRP